MCPGTQVATRWISEERLRLILEASNDGFWDFDLKNGNIYYSPRWAEILGYSPLERQPCIETWKTLMHPEDYPQALQATIDHLAGVSPIFEAEYRMLTKSGQWKWMLARGKVVSRDRNGIALRAAGTCIDITARKEAENTLRSSEDKFSQVSQNSPIMMTLTDLGKGVFIDANRAFFESLGYERYEIIGKPNTELNLYVDALITGTAINRGRPNRRRFFASRFVKNSLISSLESAVSRFELIDDCHQPAYGLSFAGQRIVYAGVEIVPKSSGQIAFIQGQNHLWCGGLSHHNPDLFFDIGQISHGLVLPGDANIEIIILTQQINQVFQVPRILLNSIKQIAVAGEIWKVQPHAPINNRIHIRQPDDFGIAVGFELFPEMSDPALEN